MGLVRMGTLPVTCEIVEEKEGTESGRLDNYAGENCMPNSGNKYCIEDDINRLFEAIDLRNYVRSLKMKCDNGKRPMSVSSSKLSGIGISEHVNLKQALRGLCISHASETAAMKRFSKPSTSRVSEAGTIKRLYSTVVVEANASSSQINDCAGSLFEISLVPETAMPSETMPENLQQMADACSSSVLDSKFLADGAKAKLTSFRLASSDQIVPFPREIDDMKLVSRVEMCASSIGDSSENVADLHEAPPDSSEASVNSPGTKKVPNRKLHLLHLNSISGNRVDKLASNEQYLIEPALKNKSLHKWNSTLNGSTPCNRGCHNDLDPCISDRETNNGFLNHNRKGAENPFPSFFNSNGNDLHASTLCKDSRKLGFGFKCSKRTRNLITKNDKTSRLKEKSYFSQSSKSSIGECSSSTSFTDESSLSGSCRSDHRPQMSKDLRWKAVRLVQHKHGRLNLSKFKLLRRIGCGDIGTVYLAELMGTNCSFALKVMDNEFLASRKKMFRAQTEKEILQMLDHPFLPTLYAHFVTESLSCLVMEYCPGGDLHVLRQRQPCRNFSEPAARFYAAEVLLALEYLHMLGIIYRDLKPENILVREDGHIMLTDFDLSLRCAANPILLISSSSTVETTEKMSSPCSAASCMHPFCLQPSWQVPCFTPLIISSGAKSRKMKSDPCAQINSRPQVVVEPTDARSNSFVGTHEYLAPEIVKGESHGNAVDWWTFGIFLFELLYGKTPFKGSSDEDTLNNIASQSLKFPTSPMVSFHARDLIRRLLVKDPENRFGSVKGAAEIKHHPFFEGLNWALIRCAVPPEMPKSFDFGSHQPSMASKRDGTNYLGNTEYCTVFDLF